MVDYKFIEKLLVRLLSLLVDVFSESEANEVTELIEAGEFGLALDTVVEIIHEESKSISPDVMDVASQAADAMKLDGSAIRRKLSNFVQ